MNNVRKLALFLPKTFERAPASNSALIFAMAALCLCSVEGRASQVQVLLFGQPCQLQGPGETFSEPQLLEIHQISPEQTPIAENIASLRASLERIKSAQSVPAPFQKYRDQRKSRLEARLKFEEAVGKAHRTGDVSAFAESTRGLIHARRHATLVSKLRDALKAGPSQRAWDELRQFFTEFSGSDGEEDFHRTLRKLKIQYQCSFEEERGE